MMRIKIITESDEDASDYKIDGCTDNNGTRREIGEKWSTATYDGCQSFGLVSN